MSRPLELPRWIEWGLLPLVNLALALGVCSAVLAVVGLPPQQVFTMLFKGAFGSAAGWSYTLFYATTFVFTGLAVAVAFHGGSFNVGGEGQAMIGGLGCALVALSVGEHLGQQLPTDLAAIVVLPMMIVAAMLGGAVWAAVPAVLLAWRGSHLVITTIMFNFIASSLMAGLLVGPLKAPGSMMVETVAFPISARMPGMHEILQGFGLDWPRTPLNLTLLLAMAAAIAVGFYLTRSRWGYELRTVGFSSDAARYAGIQPGRQQVISLLIAGALAGLVGINELAGAQHRLMLDFVLGAGFAGIAVSLIGRNHPLGIVLASILFGGLYQGGAELAFDLPGFSRDMVTTLQGLIVLFSGAMAMVSAPLLVWILNRVGGRNG
ncbi:MAG: ABC transporter permease [Betaproteobacteria bacterium]|nr:ABC transporter permease [Betaproteobacteria bacterium]NBY16317.1 ABC transporter permease [Betaproteobacteria bacterium]